MTDAPTKILLVDDDKFLLDMYAVKFAQQNFVVQSALSGEDALKVLRQGFNPDVIVFDLIMPECDGFSLLQKLQAEKLGAQSVKIALSNQNTDAEKAKAKELGADEYIVKATMIPSEVVNTVAAALSKRKSA